MAQITVGSGSGQAISTGSAPYGSPGPYSSGVWLVAKNGQGAVVDRANLPSPGSGIQFYWLGSTVGQASVRLLDALRKLNVKTDISGQNLDLTPAFQGKVFSFTPQPTGLSAWLKSASQAALFFPGAGVLGAGDAAGGAAAGGGAGGAAAGAAGGAAAGAAGVAATGLVIGDVFNQGVKDLKYGAVLLVVIIAGAALLFHGLRGTSSSGPRVVPIPV